MIEVPPPMKEIVDIKEEDEKEIKKILMEISTEKKCCLLGFIASYKPIRVTPSRIRAAEVGLSEEFGIEQAISEIKEKCKIKKCFLLLNSPGGLVESSYKIAYLLRKNFDDLTIFVPHVAASGGTLIALAGNKIVMGSMSHLTPIDIQISYKDSWVSASSIWASFNGVTGYFKKTPPKDTPYTWKVLAEKYDPIIMEEWRRYLDTIETYAAEILKMGMISNDKKAEEIANTLVWKLPSHSFVINYEKAKKIGLVVEDNEKYLDVWGFMRKWLGIYAPKSADKHFIRYILPSNKK